MKEYYTCVAFGVLALGLKMYPFTVFPRWLSTAVVVLLVIFAVLDFVIAVILTKPK